MLHDNDDDDRECVYKKREFRKGIFFYPSLIANYNDARYWRAKKNC